MTPSARIRTLAKQVKGNTKEALLQLFVVAPTLLADALAVVEEWDALREALEQATSHGVAPELPQDYHGMGKNPPADLVMFMSSDENQYPEKCPELAAWLREQSALASQEQP